MGTSDDKSEEKRGPKPLMKFELYDLPLTKRTAATLSGLATVGAILFFEARTGMSLADVVFAAKMLNTK